ncbi:hypothetical protein QBC35DRAFT_478223 [Podospora australis]|uniref:Uncharacterized protein n=1 Tax=Podospora australis TaxID=1536484 RepID=A0AAN7AE94_9PEZI|nr:hypothetical protein QBC35DRAFT_478223 [Podospora australis]
MSTDPNNLWPYMAEPPSSAPNCHQCKSLSTLKRVLPENPNGNRVDVLISYATTVPEESFSLSQTRYRGNLRGNPPCYCGKSSKQQVAGVYSEFRKQRGAISSPPGALHYVCRLGTCDYYKPRVGKEENM